MKKCLIMFTLSLLTLIVAVITEKGREVEAKVVDDIAMRQEIKDDIAFERTLPISNENTKNK